MLLRRLFLTSLLLVFALTIRAQTVKLSAREMTVKQAMAEMEKQTGKFFGFSNQLDLSRKILFNDLEVPMKKVLETIMGSEFTAEEDGNYILLRQKAVIETPGGYLSGRFIDVQSGKPIAGGVIYVLDTIMRTDRSGYFRSEKLPMGKHIVKFTSADYETAYRELQTTEKADLRTIIRLEPVAAELTVVLDKQPERLIVETPEATFEEYLLKQEAAKKPAPFDFSDYRPFAPAETVYVKRNTLLALKTNALWWATGTLNLEAEARLYRKWSLDVAGAYRPWNSSGDKSAKFWLVQPELRYWFCDTFEKHSMGIQGTYGKYQMGYLNLGSLFPVLENNYVDGSAWGLGVTYGYHMPIGKRWGLELAAGLGFLEMKYDQYADGIDAGVTKKDSRYYIGPTKLGVSFIYMIR